MIYVFLCMICSFLKYLIDNNGVLAILTAVNSNTHTSLTSRSEKDSERIGLSDLSFRGYVTLGIDFLNSSFIIPADDRHRLRLNPWGHSSSCDPGKFSLTVTEPHYSMREAVTWVGEPIVLPRNYSRFWGD